MKSNDRRDAKKLGLDIACVIEGEGGWIIQEPTKAEKSTGNKKFDDLSSALRSGWVAVPDLMASLGWQAHTVRGAISKLAKVSGAKVERRRESKVTSYRLAPDA